MALEQLALRTRVGRIAQRVGDVEVVAPAGELEPVEAPLAGLRRELGDRQVGPTGR
jgi:hypothetical protein